MTLIRLSSGVSVILVALVPGLVELWLSIEAPCLLGVGVESGVFGISSVGGLLVSGSV